MFLDAFQGQLYPIIAIIVLSFIVGVGTWVIKLFGGGKKSNKEVPLVCNGHRLVHSGIRVRAFCPFTSLQIHTRETVETLCPWRQF